MDDVWCASAVLCVLDETTGYLKSSHPSSSPPGIGWAWYETEKEFGYRSRGGCCPFYKVRKIEFIPVVKTNGGLDHHVTSTLQIQNLAVYEMPEIPDLVAYEKHGLRIVFSFPSYSEHS